MNDLNNDPSGGTLWWAKEADLQQYKESVPYRRSCPYLISALPSGRLIEILVVLLLNCISCPTGKADNQPGVQMNACD